MVYERDQEDRSNRCEMFRKLLDQAEAGDNIGVLLRGIDRESIRRGQVYRSQYYYTPHQV